VNIFLTGHGDSKNTEAPKIKDKDRPGKVALQQAAWSAGQTSGVKELLNHGLLVHVADNFLVVTFPGFTQNNGASSFLGLTFEPLF
jgi:hypothetical protein